MTGLEALTPPPPIELTLFVAPESHASALAIEHLRTAVERVAPGTFTLEVVDITREPQRLLRERVLVTPTLLANAGRRRVVGDLGNAILLDFFLRSLLGPAREVL